MIPKVLIHYWGIRAVQGRDGRWYVSTAYDPRTGKPVPDDDLLSRHDMHDAYANLSARLEAGEVI